MKACSPRKWGGTKATFNSHQAQIAEPAASKSGRSITRQITERGLQRPPKNE
jgi:hypothetical protein